jgi:predicted HTH transcriptional regulator
MQRDRYKKLAEEKTQLVTTYKNQTVSLNRQLTFLRNEKKKNYMPILQFLQEHDQEFLINVQENHHNEFKARNICYDFSNPTNYDLNPCALRQIGKSLLGFLNADGGTLYIGVEDDGLVNGIKFIDRTHLDQFTKQVDNLMLNVVPIIFDKFYDYSFWRVNDAIVILLTVPAQTSEPKKRYMFKGSREYYVRHHSMTRRIDIADVE